MENDKTSEQQITPVSQQLTFPLDKTSQDIIRRYSSGEAFPVNSIYISVDSANPNAILGYGTWAAFGAGRTLVGLDSGQTEFDTVEETGGEKTHTLTIDEMPRHRHPTLFPNSNPGITNANRGSSNVVDSDFFTDFEGGDDPHNNLQPYIVVYFWKRTA